MSWLVCKGVEIKECAYCETPVGWLDVRGRPNKVPFERRLWPRASDTGKNGYVLVGNKLTGAMWVPVRDLSDYKLRDVKWVAVRHRCDAYEIAKMRVTGLEWADEFTMSMLMSLHAAVQRQRRRGKK